MRMGSCYSPAYIITKGWVLKDFGRRVIFFLFHFSDPKRFCASRHWPLLARLARSPSLLLHRGTRRITSCSMQLVLMRRMSHLNCVQNLTNILLRLWMKQCCVVFCFAHHNAGESPELRTLLYHLARLHRALTSVVFVFDGIDRPRLERGEARKRTTPHWLSSQFKELIKLFGFSVHTVCVLLSLLLRLLSLAVMSGTRGG